MEERYPSSLRSVKSARSLRRRSGTSGKNAHEDTPESDTTRMPSRSSTRSSSSSVVSGKSRRMSTIVEDGDASSSDPRRQAFRRVSTLKVSPPLPPLPRPSPNTASDRFLDPDNLGYYPQPFSDVPLTPALRSPDLERDGDSSRFSFYLPTPDFSRQNSVRSRISTPRLSPTASKYRNSCSNTTSRTRTNDWKTDAETLIHSRPPLIPASSSNWTQKWPKPRLNPRSLGGLVAAIEESEGLGFDKPERWTPHKWALLMSILMAFGYSSVGLVYAMLTWFRGWKQAEVMCTADSDILVYITVAASVQIFTSLVGLCGAVLNSRPILAVYCLLLWPSFISLAVVGYASYKRSEFALDKKLNLAWSQWYNPRDRLAIQTSLRCCGYYNPLHQAVSSKRCFPRTTLPGCKAKLYLFEKQNLRMIWSTTFSLIPLHVLVICLSLLCSNHVTETFGKGIMPKKYRLGLDDVQLEAESLKHGRFRNGSMAIGQPRESKVGGTKVFREDRR